MSYSFNYEGFEQYLYSINYDDICGKRTYVFRFDNDYGALVVDRTNLKWEVAVINFYDEIHYILDFDTDIADDVIIDVTDKEARNILNQIKEL